MFLSAVPTLHWLLCVDAIATPSSPRVSQHRMVTSQAVVTSAVTSAVTSVFRAQESSPRARTAQGTAAPPEACAHGCASACVRALSARILMLASLDAKYARS